MSDETQDALPDAGPDEPPDEALDVRRSPPATAERVPGTTLRAVRRSLGLSRDAIASRLGVSVTGYARYEQKDAPLWMRYVLIGVGMIDRGVPGDEMRRRVREGG